ncbi:MAG TPA: alpha/beta fold hydrolase [Chloroflexota bacterium]|jgi:carboxylesterase|nr:alpha/beta fold hydrolase [Chloroflexota bacterium]
MSTPAARAPYGALVLHGLTSGLGSVLPVAERLEARGVPCAVPWLRGHGTRPEDLRGVGWRDWYADALAALDALLARCQGVAVIGLSMGGLLALHLAIERPEGLRAVVAVAPALRQAHPLAPLVPLVAPVYRMLVVPRRGFSDPARPPIPQSYDRLPTDAYLSLVAYARWLEPRLGAVRTPTLILHSRADRVIHPSSAARIYARLGTPQKELRWFARSGHEMLVDCEAPAVLDAIEAFVLRHAPVAPRD